MTKEILTLIKIVDKKNCCGCTACYSICPKNCISMKEDEEGFLYPFIDETSCIGCNLCESVCPILNKKEENPFYQEAYVAQHKDEKILRESTAGGAFTAIAEYVISQKGVVFGASMTKEFVVKHTYVEDVEGLALFRNSKYVQSDLNDTFKKCKDFLNSGRLVLYSGTPCQIEGLKSFLIREYENLITVDVVCHGVPSPLIFRKYLEHLESTLGAKVKDIKFRDKHYGYKFSTMNVITETNNGDYHRGLESDPFMMAFFRDMCDRPTCYDCPFKKRYRVSDFTIWDCFVVNRFSSKLDNDKGATRVLVHTENGRKLFNNAKDRLNFVKTSPDTLTKGVKEMFHSVDKNAVRDSFLADANQLDGRKLIEKYFPYDMIVKVKRFVRMSLYHTGLYGVAKKIYQFLIRG